MLFKVETKMTLVIQASSAEEAEEHVVEYLIKELEEESDLDSVAISSIHTKEQIPPGWKGSIPWGTGRREFVEVLLEEQHRVPCTEKDGCSR